MDSLATGVVRCKPSGPRLKEQDMVAIRRSPELHSVLAARFDISVQTVEKIRSGKTWQHVKPARATVRTKRDKLICQDCRKRFKQASTMGMPRRFCDDCRSVRQRDRKIKIRMNTLEAQLRPMVERLVREVLIEAGVLKGPNGNTRVVVQKST
jgi:hypothetical protein